MTPLPGDDAGTVTVSALSAADGPGFVEAVQASRSLHHPWIDLPDTPARFAQLLAHLERDDQAAFLVRHDACGGLVGYVSVGNIVHRAFRSAHLGYGAFAGHAGRGLMTAGLRGVVGIAFDEMGLHRVEANIQPGNARSRALARRVGFEQEGFSRRYLFVDGDWRDHERWALLAEDFRRPEDVRRPDLRRPDFRRWAPPPGAARPPARG